MSKLNPKWLNICFIIDKSGSMYSSTQDVIGGFNKIIDEQKAIKDGKVTVSLYTFNENVTEEYLGTDINDIKEFKYHASGLTAMNDGIGVGIDNVGKWLHEKDVNGEELPGKTLVVVMTDGMENASKDYTLKTVQEKIKEQTEKYSWEFMYQGCDITTSKTADELGFKFKSYSSRKNFANNYDMINCAVSNYRSMANTGASLDAATLSFCSTLNEEALKATTDYEAEIGQKISTN
jgi:uncharacterized protein YegL